MPRLTKVTSSNEYAASCRNALLAFCNFGLTSDTFKTVQELDDMTNEEAVEFMTFFVTADLKDRMSRNMCSCPVFLKRSWLLGQARLAKLADKILPEDQVKKVLQSQKPKALRFECFAASVATWRSLCAAQMSAVQLQQAKAAWQEGQDAFLDLQKTRSVEERDVLQNMLSYMRDHLKWKMAHLHDACVSIGSCPPSDVNFISYFPTLRR